MKIADDVILYSKPSRLPVDEVAPQHREVHNLGIRWGAWQNFRYAPATCNSAEGDYEKGGRDATPPATSKPDADPQIMAFDSAWRLMARRVPGHAECIRLYYVERDDLKLICRKLVLHWSSFNWYISHSRSMVKNVMRELDT